MAASKSRNTRNAKGKRKTRDAQDRSIQQETGRFQTEIIIFVLLAACIILFASNLGLGGFVGSAISNFGFGLFGLMAYIFPILFFMGSAFLLINKTNRLAYKKIAAVIVMFIFMCGAAQLLTDGYISSTTLGDYFALSADYKSGGGLIGGAICISITSAFGTVGGYVIIVLAFVVCMIIITQRSLLDFVTMIVIKIIDLVKNGRVRYQEGQPERRLRKEARAQQRQQRVKADEVAHGQTDDVLQGDQQAGCNGDHGSQLAASLLQQLGREAVADTHEEDVLGQVLDIGHVKRDVDNVHTTDDGQDDGNDQTCNNRCGDAVLLQEFAVADHPMAEEDDASRNAQSHHVVELVSGERHLLTNGDQFAKIAKQIHNIILLYFFKSRKDTGI